MSGSAYRYRFAAVVCCLVLLSASFAEANSQLEEHLPQLKMGNPVRIDVVRSTLNGSVTVYLPNARLEMYGIVQMIVGDSVVPLT